MMPKPSPTRSTRNITVQTILGICIAWAFLISSAFAVPQRIQYQGKLTDAAGQPVMDSTYSITFSLYRAITSGTVLWNETATVTTVSGSFTHTLGSVTPLPTSLFEANDTLFLEIRLGVDILTPRTQLVSSPFSILSGGLDIRNSANKTVIRTIADSSALIISRPDGGTSIILNGGLIDDSSVVLPDDAISYREIKDEPGISVYVNTNPVTMVTGMMIDLVTLEMTIPDDGFIVLEGKCYIELRGTTSANRAVIQIDEDEGGNAEFPYYTLVGLNGYVNTGSNYFPIYVTRPYFAEKGTYTFRMEGRAQNATPAEAIGWDHVLTATYYPMAYDAVKSISTESYPGGIPIQIDSLHPGNPERNHPYFLHDLRKQDRRFEKSQSTPQK